MGNVLEPVPAVTAAKYSRFCPPLQCHMFTFIFTYQEESWVREAGLACGEFSAKRTAPGEKGAGGIPPSNTGYPCLCENPHPPLHAIQVCLPEQGLFSSWGLVLPSKGHCTALPGIS